MKKLLLLFLTISICANSWAMQKRKAPEAETMPQTTPIRTPDQQLAEAVSNANTAEAAAAFRSGANPNALDAQGAPIFYDALGNRPMIKLFLSHPQFNPNHIDIWTGIPALSRAIDMHNAELVLAFISHPKINLNLPDKNDLTPLDHAYAANNHELIQLLRNKGANANRYQGTTVSTPIIRPEPIVNETFTPEVYAALGLQPNTRNAYTILGVNSTSLPDVIRTRTRLLLQEWSQNSNQTELARQVTRLIQRAYAEIQRTRGL